jgi:hypothetical protein
MTIALKRSNFDDLESVRPPRCLCKPVCPLRVPPLEQAYLLHCILSQSLAVPIVLICLHAKTNYIVTMSYNTAGLGDPAT